MPLNISFPNHSTLERFTVRRGCYSSAPRCSVGLRAGLCLAGIKLESNFLIILVWFVCGLSFYNEGRTILKLVSSVKLCLCVLVALRLTLIQTSSSMVWYTGHVVFCKGHPCRLFYCGLHIYLVNRAI